MESSPAQKKLRIIALAFACVLLLLVYGPLARWFETADRFLFDQFAGRMPAVALTDAYIVSVDSPRASNAELLETYGRIIKVLQRGGVSRIIMANPPEVAESEALPDWVGKLGDSDTRVYVPLRHRFAPYASKAGFLDLASDGDGVLRRTELWQLKNGIMEPALPLAVAFDRDDVPSNPRMANSDDAVYLSRYAELPRIAPAEILSLNFNSRQLYGSTVFLDAEPALVNAQNRLPSGQYVTSSEATAALLAEVEQERTLLSPSWVEAMEWLAPVLLAIVAVLFMPDRMRADILLLALGTVVLLLLIEAVAIYLLKVRLDLGRPIVVFTGVSLLSFWLVGNPRRVNADAFKKGSDFLAAGRLEPAFAEFRRCPPSETLAAIMYKLSLAFEQQAKPERAEAVLQWMKKTHGSVPTPRDQGKADNGIPDRLGRYVIERRIGRGAMGAVYLAKDPRINRPVAVKAIPIEKEFEDEELKEARLRFYREAESAGRLTHPNIITVFDAGEDKGQAYIAMEYVPGIALKEFTDPVKLLAPKRALELAALTAEGLDYAHNQGVIHRDIKPANLLYDPKQGSLKISDFGVARLTDNNRTKTGIVLGTPMYMSPEQLGAENLTGLSDLFSLGVTLYELLTGEVPFKASNIAVLMTKITTEDAGPVARRRAGIPSNVDSVLAKAMAKRPEDRFSCGAEMAIALRNCARIS
ncbi:MAG: protein kinase [Pseudomonadota bacterium]